MELGLDDRLLRFVELSSLPFALAHDFRWFSPYLQIDLFEAQVDNDLLLGQVSQSGQFGPCESRFLLMVASPSSPLTFRLSLWCRSSSVNPYYLFLNTTAAEIYDSSVSALNTYSGGE